MDSQISNAAARALPGAYARISPSLSLKTEKGVFYLYLPAKHVIVSQFHGRIDREAAEALRSFGDKQFEQGHQVHFFHDWEAVQGYDSEARTMLTHWATERRKHVREVVVLTQSKLVAMGVATANLATSVMGVTMRSHLDRRAFENELVATLSA